MYLNQIIRTLLATTLITFYFNVNNVWAKPIIIDNQTSSLEYLAQNKPPRRGNEWREEKLLQKLNLSGEQKEQIQQIRQKYQPEISQIYNDLGSERNKLRDMMANNESRDNLRNQHQKIVVLDQKMHNLRFESMLEVREVLTPEQRQEFATIMDQKRQNFERRRPNQ